MKTNAFIKIDFKNEKIDHIPAPVEPQVDPFKKRVH